MRGAVRKLLGAQETGLIIVVVLVALLLTALAGSHVDRRSGELVNNFWNSYTLIQTAKLNNIDPQAWLADVLARIADHSINRIGDLLPWNWKNKPATLAA